MWDFKDCKEVKIGNDILGYQFNARTVRKRPGRNNKEKSKKVKKNEKSRTNKTNKKKPEEENNNKQEAENNTNQEKEKNSNNDDGEQSGGFDVDNESFDPNRNLTRKNNVNTGSSSGMPIKRKLDDIINKADHCTDELAEYLIKPNA